MDKDIDKCTTEEVQLLVSLPTEASGNSLRENKLSFDVLSSRIKFSRQCEKLTFQHRVSDGMKYKNRFDEGDGWEKHCLCREFTCSRAHPESRVFAAIPGEEQLLDLLLKFEA